MQKVTAEGVIVTGWKATNADLTCRGFQFEVGIWHEVSGELKLCGNGFHFCTQPSGPWNYYTAPGTRVWKVEAKEVLVTQDTPGTDNKKVCRFIRLVEEVSFDGNFNTGSHNTGDYNTGNDNTGNFNTGSHNTGSHNTGSHNTGDYNTGSHNTGDYNTGNFNTGSHNTGNYNTGNDNTGNFNTGNFNTGSHNTGNDNTGDYNTGIYNTGNFNTGIYNTGYGNATDRCTGFFCQAPQTVRCFDVETGLTYEEFQSKFPHYYDLAAALHETQQIDFSRYADLPGITEEKLRTLHKKHLAAKQ